MLISTIVSTPTALPQRPLESEPVERINTAAVAQDGQPSSGQAADARTRAREAAGAASQAVRAGDAGGQDAEVAAVIAQLRARDSEVRAHEMAHLAAAGAYATSGASYTYQTGPDGRKYAVGGEVGIDVSPERDPEATIRKMQVVQQAALAPADPSAQDMRVAAAAAQAMMQAMQQLRQQQMEQGQGRDGGTGALPERAEAGVPEADRAPRDDGPATQTSGMGLVEAARADQLAWRQRLRIQQASG